MSKITNNPFKSEGENNLEAMEMYIFSDIMIIL